MSHYALVEMAKISCFVLVKQSKTKDCAESNKKSGFLSNCSIVFSLVYHDIIIQQFPCHHTILEERQKLNLYCKKTPSQVKGRLMFVWGKKEKNKTKSNPFQNSFICYKDTKGCLGPILAFFLPLENSKWHAVFPI